ncbi:MAG: glycosyltransferase family 4 protein [Anaerolineae bacterium]
MRIAIDALGLPPFGGARTSALGWLSALGAYDRDNYYVVYVSRPEEVLAGFKNIEQRVVPIGNRFAVRIWAQICLPYLLARKRVRLLHSVKNLSILGAPCPTVVTVNDLSHLVLRHLYPWVDGFYWRVVQPYVLRNATRVIAISENTKRDLIRFYGLEAEKIVTIYPSCDERFWQCCSQDRLNEVRDKYRLPDLYLLYVGGLAIHKNVRTLIQAFAYIADKVPHGLVIIGGAHHTTSDRGLKTEVAALGVKGRVRMLESIPVDDLPCLYRLADLFVSLSLNEGFGLALLEAMACGTPVLAARRGSIPEVVGEAGVLVDDPMDARAVAINILQLLSDRRRLEEMRRRGIARAGAFSWKKTAAETISLYNEVVSL